MDHAQSQRMPAAARIFIAMIGLAGLTGMYLVFSGWTPEPRPLFLAYLILALVSSGMKVVLPGVQGTMSMNFIFIMLALVDLKTPETLLLAVASMAAQTCWRSKGKVKPVHVFFNSTSIALATLAAAWIYHRPRFTSLQAGELVGLTLAGGAFFVVNSSLLAIVIALTEQQSAQTVIRRFCDWTFAYYLVGVSLAEMVHRASGRLGWTFVVALLPPLYLVFRSIRLYFGKMEQEKAHAENMSSLHLRTIEALATAIEAKDECTGDHLRRVQVYSLELAKHLGLTADEVNALQAASILHDIGKLAVPDYIISKPGKLTPDEFDKMKVHTVVGAEILEQVAFPYPVAPVVRSHHEKWDGTGYPDGLHAEDIPIGARILSAVDCLDALASDRQYRRALPLDEAMEYVAGLSGRSFDPQVVDILKSNYREFERLAQSTPLRNHRLSKDVLVSRGDAPDAGFEKSATPNGSSPGAGVGIAATAGAGVGGGAGGAANGGSPAGSGDRVQTPRDPVAAARQEMQAIVDMATDLGKSFRMEDILSILSERLKQLVPYHCLAIYVRDRSLLKARYTHGLDSRTFASLEIPMGQGLSGWVVENGKAIINGNPAVEPGYVVGASSGLGALKSALSIPLGDGLDQFSGALTLYSAEKEAYNTDHLRILLASKGDIARVVDAALRFQKAQQGSGLDELTGLPTKAALSTYLQEGFVAQRKPVTLLLGDIDEFRLVNERYGPATGDELLKLASNILRTNSRSTDYAARAGGDEFMLLLAGARSEELDGKIEALDRLVANACRGLCGEESSGMAIGVACFPENGGDADSLIAFAEQSVARAKEVRKASRNVLLQLEHSIQRPV